MNRSKNKSSASEARAPFEPASELLHVPFVLFEIQQLARTQQPDAIVPLIESVIRVTLRDPEAWQKLQAEAA